MRPSFQRYPITGRIWKSERIPMPGSNDEPHLQREVLTELPPEALSNQTFMEDPRWSAWLETHIDPDRMTATVEIDDEPRLAFKRQRRVHTTFLTLVSGVSPFLDDDRPAHEVWIDLECQLWAEVAQAMKLPAPPDQPPSAP